MMIPDAVVASALSVGGTVVMGLVGLKVYHRNGKAKDGGCPMPIQKAHGERLARVETHIETISDRLTRIEGMQETILRRLPK